MPRITSFSTKMKATGPDYIGLVNFLIKPFLEFPESLAIDCEQVNQKQKVWVRISFQETDKGRVYGRGGRNIHAIRSVLQTAATLAGQILHLDIYGEEEGFLHRISYGSREFQDSQGFKPGMKRREYPRMDRENPKYAKPPLRFRRTRSRSRS